MIHETEAKRFAEVVDLAINTLSASYQGAATGALVSDLKTLSHRLEEHSRYMHITGWDIDDVSLALEERGLPSLPDNQLYKILARCKWLGDKTGKNEALGISIDEYVEELNQGKEEATK